VKKNKEFGVQHEEYVKKNKEFGVQYEDLGLKIKHLLRNAWKRCFFSLEIKKMDILIKNIISLEGKSA